MSILPLGGVDMLLVRYIRSYKVRTLKIKFIILYILNVTDIIFTLLSVDAYKFNEGKDFIQVVKDINFSTFFIKTSITLLLLVILGVKMRNNRDKTLIHANIIIMVCIIAYILINLVNILSKFSGL